MKKALVIFMALALLFAMGSIALAKQEGSTPGNIVANDYTPKGHDGAAKDYNEYVQKGTENGVTITGFTNNGVSTHVYGTWNSPYTMGIDGFNYNDAQDYVATGDMTDTVQKMFEINGGFTTPMTNMLGGVTHVNGIDMGTGVMDIIDPNSPLFSTNGSGNNAELLAGNVNQSFTSGPHGGYLTSTHRCRECHAVHRAAGKFKLLRSDTRFEACDWCHGTGAGSGYNIKMDNNDTFTEEYNVGHTMGFGIESGKWKAPDDTYPAFTPNYWQGGFSCFDCHSPHANPSRMLGFDENGAPIESIIDIMSGDVFNLGNPGHDLYTKGGDGFAKTDLAFNGDGSVNLAASKSMAWVPALGGPLPNKSKPYYLAGSWLLIENPDREIAANTYTNVPVNIWSAVDGAGNTPAQGGVAPFVALGAADATIATITAGTEIPDTVYYDPSDPDNILGTGLKEFDASTSYPVNKVPIDWDNPIGSASILEDTQMFGFAQQGPMFWDAGSGTYVSNPLPAPFDGDDYGYNIRNPFCRSLIVDEFCTDCHDGNAGEHTIQAPLFSEDRALRTQTETSDNQGNGVTGDAVNYKGSYDLAYGHDTNVRH